MEQATDVLTLVQKSMSEFLKTSPLFRNDGPRASCLELVYLTMTSPDNFAGLPVIDDHITSTTDDFAKPSPGHFRCRWVSTRNALHLLAVMVRCLRLLKI